MSRGEIHSEVFVGAPLAGALWVLIYSFVGVTLAVTLYGIQFSYRAGASPAPTV